MPRNYFKLDLYFFEHPKVVDLSHSATLLFLASIAYSNRRETDGFIARPVVRKLVDLDPHDPEAPSHGELAKALVAADLWEPVEGGWQIHDFFDHNDSREERAEKRTQERDKKRRQREAPSSSGHVPRDRTGRPDVSPPIEVEVTEAEAESAATPRALLAVVDPPAETAQTVLAGYIDWRRAQGVNGIDKRTIGLLAKQLRQAFEAGHPPDVIKRGVVAWHERDQHPSTLASFIDVQARGGQARASPTRVDQQRQQRAQTDDLLTMWAERMEGRGQDEPNGVAGHRSVVEHGLPRPADQP